MMLTIEKWRGGEKEKESFLCAYDVGVCIGSAVGIRSLGQDGT